MDMKKCWYKVAFAQCIHPYATRPSQVNTSVAPQSGLLNLVLDSVAPLTITSIPDQTEETRLRDGSTLACKLECIYSRMSLAITTQATQTFVARQQRSVRLLRAAISRLICWRVGHTTMGHCRKCDPASRPEAHVTKARSWRLKTRAFL